MERSEILRRALERRPAPGPQRGPIAPDTLPRERPTLQVQPIIKRPSPPPSRTRMRVKSKTKTRGDRSRATLVASLAAHGVRCEIGPELARVGVPTHCAGVIQCLHERRKRSSAGSLNDRKNLIACCVWCNGWIEDAVGERSARTLFGPWLVLRQGDPEWNALSRRNGLVDPPTVAHCRTCGRPYVGRGPSGIPICGHLS